MERASLLRGRPLQLGPHLSTFQRTAGLIEITETIHRIPTGTWPLDPLQRDIGAQMMESALQGMEGFTTMMFTTALEWSEGDVRDFVEEVRRDLRDDGLRKVVDFHVVHGRKGGKAGMEL